MDFWLPDNDGVVDDVPFDVGDTRWGPIDADCGRGEGCCQSRACSRRILPLPGTILCH